MCEACQVGCKSLKLPASYLQCLAQLLRFGKVNEEINAQGKKRKEIFAGTEAYPVYNQDLADFPFLLELPGCNGHGVEEAETPGPERRKEGSMRNKE